MAFPVVVGRSADGHASGLVVSFKVDIPAGANGELLLITWAKRNGSNAEYILPTGWTNIGQYRSADNTINWNGIWRIADGTEDITVTLETTTARVQSACIQRISGHDPAIPPAFTLIEGLYDIDGEPDPPNNDTGTSKDYLWIAAMTGRGANNISAGPTGYSNLQEIFSDNGGAGSGVGTATAEFTSTAQAENPATFTTGKTNTQAWVALTIVIAPDPIVVADSSRQAVYVSASGTPDSNGVPAFALRLIIEKLVSGVIEARVEKVISGVITSLSTFDISAFTFPIAITLGRSGIAWAGQVDDGTTVLNDSGRDLELQDIPDGLVWLNTYSLGIADLRWDNFVLSLLPFIEMNGVGVGVGTGTGDVSSEFIDLDARGFGEGTGTGTMDTGIFFVGDAVGVGTGTGELTLVTMTAVGTGIGTGQGFLSVDEELVGAGVGIGTGSGTLIFSTGNWLGAAALVAGGAADAIPSGGPSNAVPSGGPSDAEPEGGPPDSTALKSFMFSPRYAFILSPSSSRNRANSTRS